MEVLALIVIASKYNVLHVGANQPQLYTSWLFLADTATMNGEAGNAFFYFALLHSE